MKISYSWLKTHIDTNISVEKAAALLTTSGLEVEGIERIDLIQGGLKGFVIGEVLTCSKHPDADRLSITTVDVGSNVVLPIVCGAPNVAAGQKVIVATVGSTVYPISGEPFVIKKSKIRGEVSEGMICAEDEIGIGASHDGIMVLDTTLPNGTLASKYLQLESEEIIEIGLTPNRADAASHLGVARDLKALLSTPLTNNFKEIPTSKTPLPVKIEISSPDHCTRYAGVVINNVKVGPSPDWLQNRLRSIGLSPINNIVDVTNYVLHDLGQPLHAFDLDKITSGIVRITTLEAGTPFTTLDRTDRALNNTDLVICNDTEPMCLAGVFGGLHSGITERTTSIFIESAHFVADSIRKSSQLHGLKTDASFRFERGTDPNMVLPALKNAAYYIQQIAGGEITDIVDNVSKEIQHTVINISIDRINSLIGVNIDETTIDRILTDLDIQILSKSGSDYSVSIPPYRVDVTREADVAEEILRIYGFDNIPLTGKLSASYLAPKNPTDFEKKRAAGIHLLVSRGYNEIITNSLTKPEHAAILENNVPGQDVVILNKLSEELGVMRRSMVFSGLESILFNINRKNKNISFFELGKTYHKYESGYVENNHLAIWITGNSSDETWQHKSTPVEFNTLYTDVLSLLEKWGISGIQAVFDESKLFEKGISLSIGKKSVAKLGKLHKEVLNSFDIKQQVYYADIDIDLLFNRKETKIEFKEISKYPEVRRDLSLIIDTSVRFEDIKKLALQTEQHLLTNIHVFDMFEGEQLGQGKKSYSVLFTLQDNKQTLTDQVIDKSMQKLMDAFEKNLGAVIRK